jgi:lipoate---protein ligase
MKWLDAVYPSPAENLACDEALLDLCEEEGEEILRFWESSQHFVVLGYANKIESEVKVEECRRRGVPILRRCTGGGTIVQGPGCLNYNLTLRIPDRGPLTTVTGTNEFVMQRHRAAMEQLLGIPVAVKGHTDLAFSLQSDSARAHVPKITADKDLSGKNLCPPQSLGNSGMAFHGEDTKPSEVWLKFSGNAQRRRRHSLIFHGTILCDFELGLINELLRLPSKRPDYRGVRDHAEFVRNVPARAADVKQALQKLWEVTDCLKQLPEVRLRTLVENRYGIDAWNLRQ